MLRKDSDSYIPRLRYYDFQPPLNSHSLDKEGTIFLKEEKEGGRGEGEESGEEVRTYKTTQ